MDVAHIAASVAPVGVKVHKIGCRHMACSPMNSGSEEQVGQESNLQPAVLEIAAACSVASHWVPKCEGSRYLERLLFQSVPFRSRALLPKLLPQASRVAPPYQKPAK